MGASLANTLSMVTAAAGDDFDLNQKGALARPGFGVSGR
jgi:hypothetical protein